MAFESLDRSRDISSTLHFSFIGWRADRAGPIARSRRRFLAKTRNVPSPLSPLQTWPTFILLFPLPADRISRYFHQLSRCLPRNLRSEDRGNCLEVALDLSLGNQKHRHGGGKGDENFVARKFEYVHVVHLLFPRKDRFGNSLNCFGLLCIYFRIL